MDHKVQILLARVLGDLSVGELLGHDDFFVAPWQEFES
jgi:hypothetical protein